MNPRTRSVLYVATAVVVLLLGGLVVAWFHLPMPVEDIDSFTYCACGYSKVRFHDGKITMIEYPHASVKPGDQIGTYHVVDDKVEVGIFFKDRVYHTTYTRDNIGLLNPPSARMQYQYCAFNRKSLKTTVKLALLRLGSEVADLWGKV